MADRREAEVKRRYSRRVGTNDHDETFRDRLSQRSEEAITEVADALLDNPLLGRALDAASGARDSAMAAQKTALGALNVSQASDVDRLERRLRSLGERIEELEDAVDRLRAELVERRKV